MSSAFNTHVPFHAPGRSATGSAIRVRFFTRGEAQFTPHSTIRQPGYKEANLPLDQGSQLPFIVTRLLGNFKRLVLSKALVLVLEYTDRF